MLCALLFGLSTSRLGLAPYNYSGALTSFLPEGSSWGMPATGLPMEITITQGGSSVGPSKFSLKGPKWASSADVDLGGLAYSNGTLTGSVTFKNNSGFALDAVRFDIVSATEQYKGKNAQGAETNLTRAEPVSEESPILLGDLPKGAEFDGAGFKATGMKWNPETTQITVTAKLSGLTYQRILFNEHSNSTVDFDSKGRLLLGSGQKPAIYRADLDKGTLDLVTSTPSENIAIASNPVDGTIAARWSNSHEFAFYTPGGDDKGKLEQDNDVPGLNDWPDTPRYDGKGNLYVCFGSTISQIKNGKPSFVIGKVGDFEFQGYLHFDVAKDGTLYIGSEKNVFRLDPGGKNGKLLIKGPNPKLGRLNDIAYVRVDPNGYVWVAEPEGEGFANRISVFDANGKFVWVLGRGGAQKPDDGFLDGQLPSSVSGIAVSPDGRVYIACYEDSKSVTEFVEF